MPGGGSCADRMSVPPIGPAAEEPSTAMLGAHSRQKTAAASKSATVFTV